MGAQLELFLLDHRKSDDVIALGRRGADTAIEHIAIDGELKQLADFGHSLGAYLTGNHSSRPTPQELMAFGGRLFHFLFRGALKSLYDRLPVGAVSKPDPQAYARFLAAMEKMR